MRRMAILVAAAGFLFACGGGEGSGLGGTGGMGGGPGPKGSFDFEPCDVYTLDELEALVGKQLKAPEPTFNGCDWNGVEPGELNFIVTLFPRMDGETYEANKGVVDGWPVIENLNDLGDKAFFGYRTVFATVVQATIVVAKGNVGAMLLLTGQSYTEEDSKAILRQAAQKYLNKM